MNSHFLTLRKSSSWWWVWTGLALPQKNQSRSYSLFLFLFLSETLSNVFFCNLFLIVVCYGRGQNPKLVWDLAGGLSSSTNAALRSLALSHSVTMSVTSKAGAYSLSSCFLLFLWLCVSSCASTKSDHRLPISPPLTMSTMRTPQPTAGLLEAASQGGKIWNKEKLANRTKKHCGKEKKRGKRARVKSWGLRHRLEHSRGRLSR